MLDPEQLYEQRLAECERRKSALKRRSRILGNVRLVAAGLALVLLWWVETTLPSLRWQAVGALLVLFLASNGVFRRIDRRILHSTIASVLYRRPVPGKGRSAILGIPAGQLTLKDENHPYAMDADVTGKAGLVDFLSIGCTVAGVRALASVLLNPATKAAILRRQQAVRELAPQVDLRERYFVEASKGGGGIRTDLVDEWSRTEFEEVPSWFVAACAAGSCLVVATIVLLAFETSLARWVALAVLLAIQFGLRTRGRRFLTKGIEGLEHANLHFGLLRDLVGVLEDRRFESAELKLLTEALNRDGRRASAALSGLCRRISLFEARRNQLVALFGPLVLFETQAAIALQLWMRRHGKRLPEWLAVISTFDIFNSLSCFAFENPDYCFPEISDEVQFKASGLSHPLLGPEAVENDVELDLSRPILLVSGANMAGKSTLLRSVAISMALTYAGAPVRARQMKVSPLVTAASIQVSDSLLKGESRFAAELSRIRIVLENIGAGRPTVAVVDELFAGTNSYDRFAGAVALMRFLADSGLALAIFSTHDRNVTKWAEGQAAIVNNVHFQDVLEGTEMHFDYKLREGPAQRGNAVELMRRAGIPMPDDLEDPTGTD